MARYIDLNNPMIIHTDRDKFGNGIYHIPPDLPTVDVMEVKHGEWTKVGDHAYRCSVCGEVSCCMGDYCPDCGAKMRKETEDATD